MKINFLIFFTFILLTGMLFVEQVAAQTVSGPFGLGMQSEQVKILQQILSKDRNIYPEGVISGFYGPTTVLAIKRFQEKYMGLKSGTPDTNGYGLAGPNTRVKINEIFNSGIVQSNISPAQTSDQTAKLIEDLKRQITELKRQIAVLVEAQINKETLLSKANTQTEISPEKTTYHIARTLNTPYECKYNSPFSSEYSVFKAQVLKEDFSAVEIPSPWDISRGNQSGPFLHFTKKDGWAYSWIENGSSPETGNGQGKFNYIKASEAQTLPHGQFNDIFLFTEPAPETECLKINQANITIPNLTFIDNTEAVVSKIRKDIENWRAVGASLPFDVYIPDYQKYKVGYYEISAKNQGLSDPSTFGIMFDFENARLYESKVSARFFDPPKDCREVTLYNISNDDGSFGWKRPCNLVTRFSNGNTVYTNGYTTYDDNKDIGTQFFIKTGETLLVFEFYDPLNADNKRSSLTQSDYDFMASAQKINIQDVISKFY